jgi:hypothetical protein
MGAPCLASPPIARASSWPLAKRTALETSAIAARAFAGRGSSSHGMASVVRLDRGRRRHARWPHGRARRVSFGRNASCAWAFAG